jgi:hypothetical protein
MSSVKTKPPAKTADWDSSNIDTATGAVHFCDLRLGRFIVGETQRCWFFP